MASDGCASGSRHVLSVCAQETSVGLCALWCMAADARLLELSPHVLHTPTEMSVEIELETKTCAEIEFEIKQKVLVTFVSSDGRLFMQLDSPDAHNLADLSEQIHDGVELTPERLSPAVGLQCVVCSAFDHIWYRAVVTAVEGGQATVYYVDYGNTEQVPATELHSPPDTTFSMPYQAVCGVLSDFVPLDAQWGSTADTLSDLVLNQELMAVFRSRSSSQHSFHSPLPCYNVTLFLQPSDDVSSVAVSLVAEGLGQFRVCSANVKVDVSTPVYTSFVDSPGEFWVQVADSSEAVEHLQNSLNDPATVASLLPLPSPFVFPGAACCAVYSEDGMYYRGEVVTMTSTRVTVHFVDYGNCDRMHPSQLKSLPPQLALPPAQAIQCCLEGVKPVKPVMEDKKQGMQVCALFGDCVFALL